MSKQIPSWYVKIILLIYIFNTKYGWQVVTLKKIQFLWIWTIGITHLNNNIAHKYVYINFYTVNQLFYVLLSIYWFQGLNILLKV